MIVRSSQGFHVDHRDTGGTSGWRTFGASNASANTSNYTYLTHTKTNSAVTVYMACDISWHAQQNATISWSEQRVGSGYSASGGTTWSTSTNTSIWAEANAIAIFSNDPINAPYARIIYGSSGEIMMIAKYWCNRWDVISTTVN